MKSRRFAVSALLVIALMISTVTIVSAHAAKSKAKFEASAAVLGIGAGQIFVPGAEFSTDVKVKYKGRGEDRHIDRIVVKTTDEGVFGGYTTVHEGCVESGEAGACATTSGLLSNQSILSLHDSRATLKLLAPPIDLHPDPEIDRFIYFGSLEGKLRGEFFVGSVPGSAKLDINGTGTYACFDAFGEMLSGVDACTKRGDGYAESNAFVPIELAVTDTGSFKIKTKPGQVVLGDRELRKMSGKLTVVVDAPGDPVGPPFGFIQITEAKAEYVSVIPHEHGKKDKD